MKLISDISHIAALFAALLLLAGRYSSSAQPAILDSAVNPANGHTYFLLSNSDWTDAEAEAVSLGGHLATVRNAAENQWIFDTFGTNRDLWIGLYDPDVGDGTGAQHAADFVWSSGETNTFREWRPGEPDNGNAGEYYAYIYAKQFSLGGEWNDGPNTTQDLDEPPLYGVVEVITGANQAPPSITSQPTNQDVALGSSASFVIAASGAQPLSYQWYFNGATALAGATNASLTLTNIQLNQAGSYAVLVSNGVGATNSVSATLTVVIPPMITQQPQSQTVLSYNSTAFTVAATGTGPLTYQWQLNGTNLVDNGNVTGSATTNLTLASVSVSEAGNYDVVVSSPYATTNSATAVLTVPETAVTMTATNAMSGSTLIMPILMNALGVENTFLASVAYDPTKLAVNHVQLGQATAGAYLQEVDTQTNNGFVGFAILLNYGSIIPAGTQEVAEVVFQALPVTNNTTVNVTFGDTPTARQVVDNNLNLLPAIYQGGSILLTPAEYAADVYPRFNGDHQLTLQDWLEEGRLVAGLDTPTNADEFLRADCAPRNAPDGVLTVADWVQAGRYALGLDPITLVTPPATPHFIAKGKPEGGPAPTRILQIANVSAQRGQSVTVPVQLVCTTNENAVGMTVSYSPNQLRFVNVSLGSALTGGRLIINSNQLTGKVGLAIALSPGATLPAGTNQVALLQFVAGTNTSGTVALALDNSVVKLEVADLLANSLAAAYVNGSVTLPGQPTVAASATGGNLQLSWPVASGTFQVQTADSPSGPWTTVVLPTFTNGANAVVTVSATNQQQYFRLQGQ